MWLTTKDWFDINSLKNPDEKMATFYNKVINNYQMWFPENIFKRCSSDKPFINQTIDEGNKLKKID